LSAAAAEDVSRAGALEEMVGSLLGQKLAWAEALEKAESLQKAALSRAAGLESDAAQSKETIDLMSRQIERDSTTIRTLLTKCVGQILALLWTTLL
jgi:hypothetical protein